MKGILKYFKRSKAHDSTVESGYICRRCGEYHKGLPLSYEAAAPAQWYTIPEKERMHRCVLSSDQCIIDDEHFFIVGNIDIPIVETDKVFSWSVWGSLSQANFERASELWHIPGRESEPPYFGWLCTELLPYPITTLHLKTNVHTRLVGVRPYIELEVTDHPLAVEQREGITRERVQKIAEIVLHGQEE